MWCIMSRENKGNANIFRRNPTPGMLTAALQVLGQKYNALSWNSAKEFTAFCNHYHLIVKENGKHYCHCAVFHREFICPHVLALQIHLKEVTIPTKERQFKHLKKRGKGRPPSLKNQGYCRPSSSSGSSSDSSSSSSSNEDSTKEDEDVTTSAIKASLVEQKNFEEKQHAELVRLDASLAMKHSTRVETLRQGCCGPHALEIVVASIDTRSADRKPSHSVIRQSVAAELRCHSAKWHEKWLHYMLLNENELDSSLSYQAYAASVAKSGTYFTELEFYIASELLGIVIGVINASGIVTWSPSNPAIDIHLLTGRDIVFVARFEFPNHYYAVLPNGTPEALQKIAMFSERALATIESEKRNSSKETEKDSTKVKNAEERSENQCASCFQILEPVELHRCVNCNQRIHGYGKSQASGGKCVVMQHPQNDFHLLCKACGTVEQQQTTENPGNTVEEQATENPGKRKQSVVDVVNIGTTEAKNSVARSTRTGRRQGH